MVRALTLDDLDEDERAGYLERARVELRTRTGPAIRLRPDGPAVRALASAIMRHEHRRRGQTAGR